MKEVRTLIASSPQALSAFLQNGLEREYHIYCQFKQESFPYLPMLRNAIGITFISDEQESELIDIAISG